MSKQSHALSAPERDTRNLPAHPTFDHDRAMWEGWQITYQKSVTGSGDYRIEPLSESLIFASAQAAWTFVASQAVSGDAFHIRTVRFIRWHSPEEWERIATHASLALGIDLLSYTSGRVSTGQQSPDCINRNAE